MFSWERMPPLVRIPLKYGVLGGVLSLAFAISFYYFGKHPFMIPPFFDIRIFLIAIFLFFSLREVRDYFFDGILFFWQGMAGSLVYLACMALVCLAGLMAFGTYEPHFVELYIAQGLALIKSIPADSVEQVGKQAVDEVLLMLPKTTLWQMAMKYTGQTFAIGFFITIIISVILRRQPKQL